MKKWNEPKISNLSLCNTLGTKLPCGRTLGANRQCNYNQANACGHTHWSSTNPGNGQEDDNGKSGVCNYQVPPGPGMPDTSAL